MNIPGLTVHHKEDGCWLEFKPLRGATGMINLDDIAGHCGPVVKSAILAWIKERQGDDSPTVILPPRSVKDDTVKMVIRHPPVDAICNEAHRRLYETFEKRCPVKEKKA